MGFNLIDLLLPREKKFFVLLSELSDHLYKGCTIFRDLTVQFESISEEERIKRLYAISDCEKKGDDVEKAIIDELGRAFITPIDRDDIHMLAMKMDKALDVLHGISRKIEIYHIRKMPMYAVKFADIIVEIARLQGELVRDLQAKRDVKEKAEAMHKLEQQADVLFHDSVAELFASEEKVQTIEMTMFKELYEQLEGVVDSIDYIGKLIRGIRAKQG